jgi:hypothetical protein
MPGLCVVSPDDPGPGGVDLLFCLLRVAGVDVDESCPVPPEVLLDSTGPSEFVRSNPTISLPRDSPVTRRICCVRVICRLPARCEH